jgi:hypothetical protein
MYVPENDCHCNNGGKYNNNKKKLLLTLKFISVEIDRIFVLI